MTMLAVEEQAHQTTASHRALSTCQNSPRASSQSQWGHAHWVMVKCEGVQTGDTHVCRYMCM